MKNNHVIWVEIGCKIVGAGIEPSSYNKILVTIAITFMGVSLYRLVAISRIYSQLYTQKSFLNMIYVSQSILWLDLSTLLSPWTMFFYKQVNISIL